MGLIALFYTIHEKPKKTLHPDSHFPIQIFFYIPDRNLSSMKNPCCKRCFCFGLGKHLIKMFDTPGSAGRDYRNGHGISNQIDQLNVKSRVGPILINTIQQYLPGSKLFTNPGKR